MYVCILDASGTVLVHHNLRFEPKAFLDVVAPFRDDWVVAAECTFPWTWLADLCAKENIAFVLGHALAMKAIHDGKAKSHKIDSEKIAARLRGGSLPQAYVYPAEMRATRDLLRRRLHLVRKRGQLLARLQNTILPPGCPSLRTKHLGLDDTTLAEASTQPAGISGIDRQDFPEPTYPSLRNAPTASRPEIRGRRLTPRRL